MQKCNVNKIWTGNAVTMKYYEMCTKIKFIQTKINWTKLIRN